MKDVSQPTETLEHTILGCQTLAVEKHLNRHNQVAVQLQLETCKCYDIKVDVQHWY